MQGPRRLNSLTQRQTVGALQRGGVGEEEQGGEAEECNSRRELEKPAWDTGESEYNDSLPVTLRVLRETRAAPLNPSYKKFTKLVWSDLSSALQANRSATGCAAAFIRHIRANFKKDDLSSNTVFKAIVEIPFEMLSKNRSIYLS